MNTLKGAWQTNLKVRPDQDWKELKGRSVVAKTKTEEWFDQDPGSTDAKLQHIIDTEDDNFCIMTGAC